MRLLWTLFGACGTIIFLVLWIAGLRPQGPTDKLLQLVLLVPSLLALAWAGSAAFRRDLSRHVVKLISRVDRRLFLLVVVVACLSFSVWMAYSPLEGIPKGGDEAAYFFQSKIFASGRLSAPPPEGVSDPQSLLPFRHLLFADGRWFIMYTPIHSLVMAPFTRLGIAPLLGPVEGALIILALFLLVREWASESVARVTVLLLVFSPFFLLMIPTLMAHNTNLLFVAWALYMLSLAWRRGKNHLALWSGLLLGLALGTKPYTALAWWLFVTIILLLQGRRGLRTMVSVLCGALLPVGLFLASNWYYTGSPFDTPYQLARGGSLIGFGPESAWYPVYGDHAHTPLRGLRNLLQQGTVGSVILFGWPGLSLVPLVLGIRRARQDRRLIWLYGVLGLVMLMMFIHYSPSTDYGPRHYFTLLPVVLLLSAAGIAELAKLARRRWGDRGGSFAALSVMALFAISVCVYMPGAIELRSGPWQAIDREVESLSLQHAEPPAVVFMQASEHGYPNIVSGLNFDSPMLDGDFVYVAHQTAAEDSAVAQALGGRNAYLFWHDGSGSHLEQWSRALASSLDPVRELEPIPASRDEGR